jgi:hypothetical protein
MLTETQVVQLEALMPEGTELFSVYWDPAYPTSPHLFSGFRRPLPGSPEAAWNACMSKVRIAVEWLFKEISAQWKFLGTVET